MAAEGTALAGSADDAEAAAAAEAEADMDGVVTLLEFETMCFEPNDAVEV